MITKELTGVILAAGKGTRMHPFSGEYPKPMLPVGNKPLLCHQIECMKNINIRQIIIVIGHLGYEIAKRIGDGGSFGVRIKYVEQKEMLGIAHAVGQLEPYVASPFLLFLGDIFFIPSDIAPMVEAFRNRQVAAVLAVKRETDSKAIMKNFSVILDGDNRVQRVIEKPRFIQSNLKGCGLYLFDLSIFDAIRRTPRTAMRDEYEITESIQIMIEDGLLVRASPLIKEDVNLTTPQDLIVSNMKYLELRGEKSLIGQNARINPNARIVNSTIGDNTVIENPVNIRNTVIFPNSKVKTAGDLYNVIVTPRSMIQAYHYADQHHGEVKKKDEGPR